MGKSFYLNVPISKIDEEQRIVTGIATTEALDSQGDIVDYEASKKAFSDWTGNIREMHNPIAIGKRLDVQFDDANKAVVVSAKISESADGENAWQKVKEGILTGFSIGGRVFEVAKDKTVEGANRVMDYALSELSLVDNPACPDAKLLMVKSVDGKAQMTKAGIAVVDGDARDATAASVTHVVAGTAPVKGGTIVPKKVIGADGRSYTNKQQDGDMKKSVYDASTALSLATQLAYLIMCEADEPDQAADLVSAFNSIRDFVGKEVAEGDDFDMSGMDMAMELANKAIDLRKGKDMSEKKVEKTNVIGGVERDEKAEVVADERPVNAVETETDAAPVAEDAVVEPKEDKAVKVEVEEKVEEPVVEAPKVEEAPVVEEPKTEAAVEAPVADTPVVADEKKSDSATDLIKNFETLLAKLNDGQGSDLKKVADAVSDLSAKVEKFSSLEERISTLEKQPLPQKTKASYSVVEKGVSEVSSDVDALVKRQAEITADPSLAKPGENFEIYKALRAAQTGEQIVIS